MADISDVLLKIYEEQWSQGRQLEEQRATFTNYIITISSLSVGFIIQNNFEIITLPIAVLVFLLGIYGTIVTSVMYSRFKLHSITAFTVLDKIESIQKNSIITEVFDTSFDKYRSKFPKLNKVRLHKLWRNLHLIITLVGLLCIAYILFKYFGK